MPDTAKGWEFHPVNYLRLKFPSSSAHSRVRQEIYTHTHTPPVPPRSPCSLETLLTHPRSCSLAREILSQDV